jgi:tetraacyldisaccharide 4'-kinase
MKRAFPQWWLSRTWKSWALLDISLAYGGAIALRRGLYRGRWLRATRLPVPVVVVGGILVGGTGKTPLTLWLIEQLRSRGWKPGVVSRGYGGSNPGKAMIVNADTAASLAGDEAALIARQSGVSVTVGKDRVAAAQLLLRTHPDVNLILADDGLQHLRLARDVEIAVVDSRGMGNGFLLPAGPLRERPDRLASVSAVVLRGQAPALDLSVPTFQMNLALTALRHANRGEVLMPAEFASRFTKRLAAAGIGYPQQFFDSLAAAGLQCDTLPLPDHFDFAKSPFPTDPELAVIVTEKDVLKTDLLNDDRLWVAQTVITVEPDLVALIERTIEETRGSQAA